MHVVRRDYGDTIATPPKKITLKGKLAKLKSSMTFFKARKSESFLENESWNLTGQSHMKKLPRKTDQLNNLCQMLLCGIVWKLCSSVRCKYLVIPFRSQGMHFCAVNTSDWKTWTQLKVLTVYDSSDVTPNFVGFFWLCQLQISQVTDSFNKSSKTHVVIKGITNPDARISALWEDLRCEMSNSFLLWIRAVLSRQSLQIWLFLFGFFVIIFVSKQCVFLPSTQHIIPLWVLYCQDLI